MKFNQNMIGKKVKEVSTGDTGVVIDSLPGYPDRIKVKWFGDYNGVVLSIGIDEVVFIPDHQEIIPEEITIDGKRYKLIPMD